MRYIYSNLQNTECFIADMNVSADNAKSGF